MDDALGEVVRLVLLAVQFDYHREVCIDRAGEKVKTHRIEGDRQYENE
jgi:hypothetical protein